MESYAGQVSLQKDDRVLDPSDPLGYSDINTADETTTITVRDYAGDALSTIFSDNVSTPLSNPFNAGAIGGFTFYAANGNYNVIVNEGLATEKSINDIQLFDPDDVPTSSIIHADLGGVFDAGAGVSDGHIDDQAQEIAGVKTFSSSPIVPEPTTDLQATTKKYVDDSVEVNTLAIEALSGITATPTQHFYRNR